MRNIAGTELINLVILWKDTDKIKEKSRQKEENVTKKHNVSLSNGHEWTEFSLKHFLFVDYKTLK